MFPGPQFKYELLHSGPGIVIRPGLLIVNALRLFLMSHYSTVSPENFNIFNLLHIVASEIITSSNRD
jgi:hypothetical protein